MLLHVVFYSKIGEEKEAFDFADVCTKLTDKLIYRHPHIYGNVQADTAEAVIGNWEKLKQSEKDGNKTVLGGVINAARLYGVKPENALEHTNRKFIDRFNYIEAGAKAQGKKVSDLTLAEMDTLWDEYKKNNENR